MKRAVRPWRWPVLGLATLTQIGNSLPQQTPAAIGTVMISALGLSRAELGLLTSAIWGGMLLGLWPSGVLVDRYGERRMVGISSVGLGTLVIVASFAGSFVPLFATLTLAAAVGASSGVSGARAITRWFSARERGFALGVRQTGVTLAGVVASLVLPGIALAHGWTAAFQSVGVAVIVAGTGFALFYREPGDRDSPPIGPPMHRLLVDRTFVLASVFAWMYMGAMGVSIAYIGVSLHEAAGLPIVSAAGLLAVLQVGGVLGRAGWGAVSDRIGSRGMTMAMTSCLGIVAAIAMAIATVDRLPYPLLALIAGSLGISTAGWNALYIAVATDLAPDRPATLIGAGSTFTFTGLFVLTPCFGFLVDRTHSYAAGWIALAAWSVLATAIALVLASVLRSRARPEAPTAA